MVGIGIIAVSISVGFCVWMLGIRPHIARTCGRMNTGATWGVTAWADWHVCRELSLKNGDVKARRLSMIFTTAQVGVIGGLILAICGI